MPTEHFTRDDAVGILLGAILFAPFLLSPGFVLGWVCNLLDFRKQPLVWRLIMSVPFSIAFFPIVNFLVGAYISWTALWILYGGLAVGFVLIFLRERNERPAGASPPRWLVWPPLAWAAIIVISGVDLQWGNRLYPSILAYDFNVRTAFINGITRHGLPAINPLFYPQHLVPLRYHYFWYIACSLVQGLGGTLVGPRPALIASHVWCGWGVMGTVALYLKFFHPRGDKAIWKRLAWGLALCCIGGLDIIPNLILDSFYWMTGTGWTPASLEWWNDPVTPFATATLWVAHHVGSVVACLIGFLVAFWGSSAIYMQHWTNPSKTRPGKRVLPFAMAGLAFASSAGLSIYVSFVFAVCTAAWIAFLFYRRQVVAAAYLCLAGAIAGLLVLPYLRTLGSAGGAGGHFLTFGPRFFYPINGFLPYFGFSAHQTQFADILFMPLNYFIEAGVAMVTALILIRRFWRRRGRLRVAEQAAACLFVASLLTCSFVRSGVIANNDLGWRGLLIAQFFVLIWSPELFRAWWRLQKRGIRRRAGRRQMALARWRRRTLVLVSLGAVSMALDFFMIRTSFIFSDTQFINRAGWMEPFEEKLQKQMLKRREPTQIGRRTFAMRQLYSTLEKGDFAEKPGKIQTIQANSWLWDDMYHALYAQGEEVSFSFTCGTEFGGNPGECLGVQLGLYPLFNDPTAAERISIDDLCTRNHIDVLVVNDIDPVFWSKSSWVWRRNPIFANDMARAFRCGSALTPKELAAAPTLQQTGASSVVFLPRH